MANIDLYMVNTFFHLLYVLYLCIHVRTICRHLRSIYSYTQNQNIANILSENVAMERTNIRQIYNEDSSDDVKPLGNDSSGNNQPNTNNEMAAVAWNYLPYKTCMNIFVKYRRSLVRQQSQPEIPEEAFGDSATQTTYTNK